MHYVLFGFHSLLLHLCGTYWNTEKKREKKWYSLNDDMFGAFLKPLEYKYAQGFYTLSLPARYIFSYWSYVRTNRYITSEKHIEYDGAY